MDVRAPKRLPKRDWFLLPLLSLLTVAGVLVPTELISRAAFSSSPEKSLRCMVLNDMIKGVRAVPNCTCSYKIPESGVVQYRFNNCGYRTSLDCGTKPFGTYRIVLVGTSMAEGLHVPSEETFAALVPRQLSQETGRKVDLYDEALEWESPHRIDQNFEDVLAPKPDLILWTVTKWDVENASLLAPASTSPRWLNAPAARTWRRLWVRMLHQLQTRPATEVIRNGAQFTFGALCPGTSFLLEHLFFENRDEYLERYLASDEETDFLRTNLSSSWQEKLNEFEVYFSDVERQSRRARVRLVVAVLPTRAEATLIAIGRWPPGLSPYKLGEEVRSIVERNGGDYIDLLHSFSNLPDTDQFYYPVDGHPNARGQAVFASLLVKGLMTQDGDLRSYRQVESRNVLRQ